jgi:hypothetical protein
MALEGLVAQLRSQLGDFGEHNQTLLAEMRECVTL